MTQIQEQRQNGGKREGSGRKKGQLNKTHAQLREEILASGLSPLQYMIDVMRDETVDADRRDRMAGQASPYLHPRLTSSEVSGQDGGPIQHSLTIKFAAGAATKEE